MKLYVYLIIWLLEIFHCYVLNFTEFLLVSFGNAYLVLWLCSLELPLVSSSIEREICISVEMVYLHTYSLIWIFLYLPLLSSCSSSLHVFLYFFGRGWYIYNNCVMTFYAFLAVSIDWFFSCFFKYLIIFGWMLDIVSFVSYGTRFCCTP